ncbi:POTRA domain-containing protein [Xenorhabdus cabanillasii]|uniref:Hemolysin activation/secretion protein n=1 Tax=Xenorhabdus cabanillasii JM26 TaxID=1427517 RepID=W1IP28_9GAMM
MMATVTRSNMLTGLAGWAVFAVQPVQADDQPFIHQTQQQQALEQRLEAKAPTVRLSAAEKTTSVSAPNFPKESPCFVIHTVTLSGREDLPHWVPLQRLAEQANGHCLGAQGIGILMSNMQNRLISHGWVTTRILAPEQDLSQGELKLNVVAGKIR